MERNDLLHELGNALCGAEEDLARLEKGAEFNAQGYAAFLRFERRVKALEALRVKIEKENR